MRPEAAFIQRLLSVWAAQLLGAQLLGDRPARVQGVAGPTSIPDEWIEVQRYTNDGLSNGLPVTPAAWFEAGIF
jgi:hypothetical protein